MWTLRDLWHLIDPQAKREWEMEQRFPGGYKGGDIPPPLHETLQSLQNNKIENSPPMNTPAAKKHNEMSPLAQYQYGADMGYNALMGKLKENLFGMKGTL